jgi:PhnB protein
MSDSLAHVRHGMGAVRPYVYGPLSLLKLVTESFGAVERERHEMGPSAIHVEVQIRDSMLVLEMSDPPHAQATAGSIYFSVPDVDAAHQRALDHGAQSILAPCEKPYQERSAGVKDALGNRWWISTFRR